MKKIGICFLMSLCLFCVIPPTAGAEPEKEKSNKNTGHIADHLLNIDQAVDHVIGQIRSTLELKGWKRVAVVEIKSSGVTDDTRLENYLIEQLTLKVNRLEGITIVEKGLFNQALIDLDSDFIDLANPLGSERRFFIRRGLLHKIGELTHADMILSGIVTALKGKATIAIGMIDSESKETYRIAEEKVYSVPEEQLAKTVESEKPKEEQPLVLSKQRFYLGLGSTYTTIRGNFNGESVVSGPSGDNLVPDIDSGNGLSAFVGYKFDSEWAFEFSSLASNHQAKWSGISKDVHYKLVSYDIKYNFMVDSSKYPYILIGLGIHEIVVEEGKSTGVGDAVYGGTGINLGMGVAHYSTSPISIGARVTYHVVNYDKDKGVNVGALKKPIDGDGISLLLSAIYYF